ncbi:MAG: hypothetical protein Q8O50_01010 [Hydrogenophaga sp.]|nr:hypothetical protein [Hydrogenophaga sp.]
MGFAGNLELSAIDLQILKKYRLYLNRLQPTHGPSLQKGDPLSIKTQGFHLIALRAGSAWWNSGLSRCRRTPA